MASRSPSVSGRGRVDSRGERTADGPTGWYQVSSPRVSRPRWTIWAAATAPSERIASARAANPGTDSGRHASLVILRRHVDSGAVTVPPTVIIAAPPAARRRQYSASPGSASPSWPRPRPWAVPTMRLRSVSPARSNGRAACSRAALRAPLGDGAAPADGLEVAVVGLALGPAKLEHEPADLPAVGLAAKLVVVAPDEQLRSVRLGGEDLVGRVVDERLGVVAVDLDVVDAEEVVLPDHVGAEAADPLRDGVAALDRVGVAVLRHEVVGQDGAQALP